MKLSELEEKLNEVDLPGQVQLTPHELIFNPRKFIDTHIKTLKGQTGNKTFMPYYNRLLKLYKQL